jgi:hypothetical protein
MARSPIYSAQTRLRWSETWLDDSKVPVDLTNPDLSPATITLRILDAANAATTGTGTVTPVDMKNGKFKYQVKPADFVFPALFTDPPTKYNCQYVCTYVNGEILDGDFFQITCLKSI